MFIYTYTRTGVIYVRSDRRHIFFYSLKPSQLDRPLVYFLLQCSRLLCSRLSCSRLSSCIPFKIRLFIECSKLSKVKNLRGIAQVRRPLQLPLLLPTAATYCCYLLYCCTVATDCCGCRTCSCCYGQTDHFSVSLAPSDLVDIPC